MVKIRSVCKTSNVLFSLLFTVILLAGCGASSSSPASSSPTSPVISSFAASPATITVGSSSALTAVFSNGTGVIAPGNLAVTSGVAVNVTPTASTVYTLTVTSTTGSAVTQSAAVTVNAVPVPVISSFAASPATVTAGSNSALTAVFTNGTGVITPGNLAVTSGVAVNVTPTASTTYTLTVTPTTGAAITQTTAVTVNAAAIPVISSFAASPATITAGSSSALTAVFTNGTGVITPGNVAVTSGTAVTVTPTATTAYTLTVTPASGAAVTQSTTVTVNAAVLPVISSFAASPATITAGSSSALTAVFTNGTGVITPGNLAVTSGTAVTVTPTATTAYTLTVTPTTGAAVTQSTTVTVNAAALPVISSFAASPTTITAGSSSALTAVFTNGTGVITPGNLAITSGVAVTVTPTATTAYTLTVTPTTGSAVTQSTTVTVNAASLIADGTYTITSKSSGMVVEVPGSSLTSGTTLDQATYTGAANQIWKLTNLGSNYVELSNVNSGLAIETPSASLVHGQLEDQAPFTSGTNQIWQVVASGSYIILVNENSLLALDVYGNSTTAGAGIDQWPNSGTTNQAWTFTAAVYTPPTVTSVSISPGTATVTIGQQQQFTATVKGAGNVTNTVTWTLGTPSNSTLSAGTITAAGLYTTPYPAPATVTLTATSTQDTTKSTSVTVTLSAPAAATGPALSVDLGNPTHAINPYIYGMNGNDGSAMTADAKSANLTIDRWGGDGATRYNYQTDSYNSASDYWFQNERGSGPYPISYQENSQFNQQVVTDALTKTKTLGTVPLIGYTTLRTGACSYSVTKYGAQQATEPYNPDCGNGVLLNGSRVVNDPTDTSVAIDETFTTGWIKYLVGKFGTAANGGVAVYDLDNEPADWHGVHADVHPVPFTYDEVTNKGLTYSAAIKAQDPTAEVSGPVMDSWWAYFYSEKDVTAGYSTSPCYTPWANPIDRKAHSGIPFLEYYLQQFAAYDKAHGVRLLDYLDIHGYYAAHPSNNTVAFALAGDTSIQQARVDSTRAFWDPTYTDSYYTYPNYPTDSNYVSTCNPPLRPLQLIPTLKQWVANDYPGTKVAIDEYNFGALESINGAITQADVLGIFGAQGLDMGLLWGTPDPVQQVPGVAAFQIYRNYDGNNSTFGDTALASTSGNQGALSVYGALRTADSSVTVVVINKTYGDLSSTLSLANLTPNGKAQVFLYSNANLPGIVQQTSITVTPPAVGATTSAITATFPAQSITLLVIPKH